MTASDSAIRYRAKGWAPLPLPSRAKAPGYANWQVFKADDATPFNGNIGLLLGERSNGLVDIDLDCTEAVAMAGDILPPTDAIFGRHSKPRSHRLYQCDPVPETHQFEFDKAMLLELRSSGVQTVVPPSRHPSGELVEWACEGAPAPITGDQLRQHVGDLAGLCLLARHWPEPHGRYNAEGALIGALLRVGRSEGEVVQLIETIQRHKGATRQHPPTKSVPRLAGMLAAGRPVPGLGRLRELFGAEIAGKVAEWMRLRRADALYEERDGGIYWMMRKETKTGVEIIPVRLCNFAAAIDQVVTRDDGGGSTERHFVVAGSRGRTEVRADEFDSMAWVTNEWGPWASVAPGQMMKPHAAQAIKHLSDEAEERIVYTHTGWRQIEGRWLYLHAGGAIGADGPVEGVAVELEGELAHLVLPAAVRDDLKGAVRAALGLLDLNATIAAATWRAPLIEFCPVTFSAFMAGPTGSLKSAVWGVGQAFWGPHWDGVRFPANWSGTVNSIEKIAFVAKDALLVIDDFAPSGSRRAVTEIHEKAERLLRAAGNLGGRSRMRADTSLRATYWPRALLASSGEDVPAGHSLRARMAIEQVGSGDINPGRLSALQDAARAGLLAEAMSGYLAWIAGRADVIGDQLRQRQAHLRGLIVGVHRRTPDTTASLALGIETFLAFAEEAGAIDAAERARQWETAWRALCAGAAAQGSEQREENPVPMFIEAIPEVLAAGMAHVAERDGEAPQDGDPNILGWQKRLSRKVDVGGDGSYIESETAWMPQGDCIGWVAGGQLWLLPAVAFKAVEMLLRGQGKAIPITAGTLGKRLRDAGWLLETGEDKRPAKVVTIGGGTVRVLVISRDRVLGEKVR